MQVGLKTKITLTIALLVLAVVGVNAALYIISLTRQVIQQADNRAGLFTQQVFFQAQNALADAANAGETPASNNPADMREYVREALSENDALHSLIESEVGYSFLVYEVSIVDTNGTAMVSSDPTVVGTVRPRRPSFSKLVSSGFVSQLRAIYGPPSAYEVTYPFQLGSPGNQTPFGEIRVAMQTGLLRTDVNPGLKSAALLALGSVGISVLLAALVSNISLTPLKRITAQLDRISRGEFDQKPLESADEFGQVSTKISQIGLQLRGVREIFSTLRENLDQVLGGLDDGLLLFSLDGRAVMVSPAAERFLGLPADQLLGRRAEEIFPSDHPVREAVKLSDGQFEAVSAADVLLPAPDGPPRRVAVSVQVIAEGRTRMGSLLTFTDLESRERITTQLQVSERLAQLGRITAGVAHEVKNPLNSMRLWLENLRGCLTDQDPMSRQAMRVLDSEIDRLDTVVKRFLDFTRPPELHQEETSLATLLDEVLAIEQPLMERSNVRVERRFARELPAVVVDRQLLKQALVNLVLNAIQAMPGGGCLKVSLQRRSEMAQIEIEDTGEGIAPEHRQRIFQLFFTTHPGGSGIGLASAFRTVQLLNGSIDFKTEVGHGTTFRIELPLAYPLEPALSRTRDVAAPLVPNS